MLKDVIDMPNLEPLRKMDPRKGVESVLAFVERYKLPDHVREDFLSSYEGDRFVVNGEYLHERLPHNKFDRVNAGHFAWADVADEYADLIIDWWEGGHERSAVEVRTMSHN